jgi:hypothetical protein
MNFIIMLFFHISKQKKMKYRIKKRQKAAIAIETNITKKNLLTDELLFINKALESAHADETSFRQFFDEEMPSHMKKALQIEILHWRQLKDTVDLLTRVQISPEEYQARAKIMLQTIQETIQVEALEMEMLYSPLKKHYDDILSGIESRIA